MQTLKRFNYFVKEKDYISQFDYCYYFDVDMGIVDKVGDEVLTSGGFYAVVKSIQTQDTGPSSIIFELASGIEVEGTAIAIDTVNPRGSTLQPLNKVDGPEA